MFKHLPVSNFMRSEVKMRLKAIHKGLVIKFSKIDDQAELFGIVCDLYKMRIAKKVLTWYDVQDIADGITQLLEADITNGNGLLEMLIAIDFDYIEILHYRVELWRSDLLDIVDIRDQIEFLVKEKHKIAEILLLSKRRRFKKHNQLANDLTGYLIEFEQFLREILSLQVSAAQDIANARSARRFQVSLSVAQLALFIRLQIERGILPRENLSSLFKFVADHFYTSNALFISPENLQKKSTDIEFSTARKMKGQLIGMINWLNANYNLANYN
jgi:hypothetical protein